MSVKQQYPIVNELLAEYFHEAGDDYASLTSKGIDPFYIAIRSFDLVTAKFWFETLGDKFTRNKEYPHGQTILYLAVQDANLKIIRTLIEEMRFDINHIPEHGYSILGNAIENCPDEIFRYLLTLPNINYQIRDQIAPFSCPLDRGVKIKDLTRVSVLIMAMLKNNKYLNPADLQLIREGFADTAGDTLLNDYVINLKHHLAIHSQDLKLTHDYTASKLLGYLELWNVQARVADLNVAKVIDQGQTHSGAAAVTLAVNNLLPLIGFGMLAPAKLITAFKTIKYLDRLYKLPANLRLDYELDVEVSQAIKKYSSVLTWSKLEKFTAKELYELGQVLSQFAIFKEVLQPHTKTAAIAAAIVELEEALTVIMQPKLPGVVAFDVTAKIMKTASAMQQVKPENDLAHFVAALERNNLPKATKAFLFSPSDHMRLAPSALSSQPTFVAETQGRKNDLYDLFG